MLPSRHLALLCVSLFLLLLSCAAASDDSFDMPPPGVFTTDASFDRDTHAVIEPTGVYTMQDLETAQPGLRHRLTPFTDPSGEFRMKPVRVVHARAVASMPVYDTIYERFIGTSTDESTSGFVAAMDSVTSASVEGVLLYVQTQAINQTARSVVQRCRRRHGIQFVVFYELLIAQPVAALATFQDNSSLVHEYGPFVAMNHGRCSPISSILGQDELPIECYAFNGNKGEPAIGPFVGAVKKDNESGVMYDDAYWFSFPHSCPLQPWSAKTPECRAQTRAGLCPPGKTPDGVHCTYTHSILGFLPLDDLVNITALTNNATGQPFANFSEFCRFGGVEFEANGDEVQALPFWQYPLDASANTRRTHAMIQAYNRLAGPDGHSSQIFSRLREKMRPLPTLQELADDNPPCYESVKVCSMAKHGCRRETYAQICRVCATPGEGCVKPPLTFAFPQLTKPVVAMINASSPSDSDEQVDVGPIVSGAMPSASRSLAVLLAAWLANST